MKSCSSSAAEGVPTATHYPRALPSQPALAEFDNEDCPVADSLAQRVLSLPMHHDLTDDHFKIVAEALAKVASGGELSRVMLAIRTILASADQTPTVIFDEVDAGIGGGVARNLRLRERLAHRNAPVLYTRFTAAVTQVPLTLPALRERLSFVLGDIREFNTMREHSREYSMVFSNCDTLTLKAPYLTCQPKSRCSGKVSCTHFEEPPLMSCRALASG